MKLTIKIILLITLILIGMMIDSATPVITNDLAMTQMENSDELLVVTNTYNRIKPVIEFAYTAIVVLITCTIACDIFKLVNPFKSEN